MKRYVYMSLLMICMGSHAMEESGKKNLEKGKRRFSLPSLSKLFSKKDEDSGSNPNSPRVSKSSFSDANSSRMTKNSFNDRSSSDGRLSPRVFFDLQSNGTRAIYPEPEEKEGSVLSPRGQSSHVNRVLLSEVKDIVARANTPPPERKKSASTVYYVDTDTAGSSSTTVDALHDSKQGTVFNNGSLDESIAMVMSTMKVKKQDDEIYLD